MLIWVIISVYLDVLLGCWIFVWDLGYGAYSLRCGILLNLWFAGVFGNDESFSFKVVLRLLWVLLPFCLGF